LGVAAIVMLFGCGGSAFSEDLTTRDANGTSTSGGGAAGASTSGGGATGASTSGGGATGAGEGGQSGSAQGGRVDAGSAGNGGLGGAGGRSEGGGTGGRGEDGGSGDARRAADAPEEPGPADAPLRPTYSDAILQDQPLGYWRLDEASGPLAYDSSGHHHDCTYLGNFQYRVPGALPDDGAVMFMADGVQCDNTSFGFAGRAPFSLEAWVRSTSKDKPYQRILAKELSSPDRRGYTLYVNNGSVFFERWAAGTEICEADRPLTADAFNHVVATFDGANISIYVNGAMWTNACSPVNLVTTDLPFTIGDESDRAYGGFVGTLDEAVVYGYALPAARVAAHLAAAR
jgi:hypothetical protein